LPRCSRWQLVALEAIFGSRESSEGLGKQLISQLLLELDNCGQGVVILAATNHPEAIDTSILRPGRLDRLVYVPPPNFEERMVILQILKQTTRFSEDIDLRTVSSLTNNFTGADLKALVRKACLCSLKASRANIETQTFPPPYQISSHQSVIWNCSATNSSAGDHYFFLFSASLAPAPKATVWAHEEGISCLGREKQIWNVSMYLW
jgi:SpoVK/Ycf46/Vps4 family AAA+-type ATPase